MVSNCLWERDREEGGTVPSQQSRRYQRADCDGGWEHSTRHFSHVEPSVLTLHWHTIIHGFFLWVWKGQKQGHDRCRFVSVWGSWSESQPQGALHYSAARLTHRPLCRVIILIFTNQMWHSERLLASVLCNLSKACSFATLSTGIHTDSQRNLFWKRHAGLMCKFCPKYGSFVVVMPPEGNGIVSAWHLLKAALTHRAKCQDKGYQRPSSLPQLKKPQESVVLLLYVPPHAMPSLTSTGLAARHRLPPRVSLCCQLPLNSL